MNFFQSEKQIRSFLHTLLWFFPKRLINKIPWSLKIWHGIKMPVPDTMKICNIPYWIPFIFCWTVLYHLIDILILLTTWDHMAWNESYHYLKLWSLEFKVQGNLLFWKPYLGFSYQGELVNFFKNLFIC